MNKLKILREREEEYQEDWAAEKRMKKERAKASNREQKQERTRPAMLYFIINNPYSIS